MEQSDISNIVKNLQPSKPILYEPSISNIDLKKDIKDIDYKQPEYTKVDFMEMYKNAVEQKYNGSTRKSNIDK